MYIAQSCPVLPKTSFLSCPGLRNIPPLSTCIKFFFNDVGIIVLEKVAMKSASLVAALTCLMALANSVQGLQGKRDEVLDLKWSDDKATGFEEVDLRSGEDISKVLRQCRWSQNQVIKFENRLRQLNQEKARKCTNPGYRGYCIRLEQGISNLVHTLKIFRERKARLCTKEQTCNGSYVQQMCCWTQNQVTALETRLGSKKQEYARICTNPPKEAMLRGFCTRLKQDISKLVGTLGTLRKQKARFCTK